MMQLDDAGSAVAELPATRAWLEAPRVLVVDDDEGVRTVIPQILARAGLECEFEVASDGLEGLLQVAVFSPDAIILDLDMPEMDGVEFYRQLQCLGPYKPKVVVLSGRPVDERFQQTLRSGADTWMRKPPDWGELVRVMGETVA